MTHKQGSDYSTDDLFERSFYDISGQLGKLNSYAQRTVFALCQITDAWVNKGYSKDVRHYSDANRNHTTHAATQE